MASIIIVSLNTLVFVLLLPYLETGSTHVLDPSWPGHAKVHAVWQIITNAIFALIAGWLVWRTRQKVMAHLISLVLSGSFIMAYLLQHVYGGSMKYTNGVEPLVLGVHPGFAILGVLSVLQIVQLVRLVIAGGTEVAGLERG